MPAVPAALVAQLGLKRARDLAPAPARGDAGAGIPARHSLPVTTDISRLLPSGALAAQAAISAGAVGALGLLWRLLAGPTTAGAWCAVVGLRRLYPLAAAAAGADLDRIALVDAAGPRIADAANALADGLAALVVPSAAFTPAQTRRLASKARRAGTALIWWETRPVVGVDARLSVTRVRWEGLRPNEDRRYGHGALRSCELDVAAAWRTGRGARESVWPYGGRPEASNVVELRRRR
ncbi:hypothetical protein LO763_20085 [Glycomyces sp. A-F 0318]|uniref:hypothetical protein n=1 Tax=Glycomyces amatae TaxID=2881355 RepID=UPI001E427EBA|nr:hypothetical protein [Glycomyces amatae]MCD0445914.1 hypothetical protein [Glycomyces amatae]